MSTTLSGAAPVRVPGQTSPCDEPYVAHRTALLCRDLPLMSQMPFRTNTISVSEEPKQEADDNELPLKSPPLTRHLSNPLYHQKNEEVDSFGPPMPMTF